MKTPALQEALRFLKRLVDEAKEVYDRECDGQQTSQLVHKARADAAKGELKRNAKKKDTPQEELERLAAEVSSAQRGGEPLLKRYLVNDATVEKLGEILCDNPNGVLLFRDELTGLFKILDKNGHESDRAFYLEAWAGKGSFSYDRIERGTVHIPRVVVSILGGIQPGPLGRYLRGAISGGGEEDDGLMPRFQLLVYPDQPADWEIIDELPDGEALARAAAVFQGLNRLEPGPVGAEVEAGDDLPFLRFSHDAQGLFYEWWTALEAKVRSGRESPAIESHLSKYRSLMPSLALLFHLITAVDERSHGPVSLGAAATAAAWCDYLEQHARRIYELGARADPEPARRLAERIRAGEVPGPVTAREVARKGWSGLDRHEDVSVALGLLEEKGWVYGVEVTSGPTGGRPTTVYHVNPRATGASRDEPNRPPRVARPGSPGAKN